MAALQLLTLCAARASRVRRVLAWASLDQRDRREHVPLRILRGRTRLSVWRTLNACMELSFGMYGAA
eukprot:2574648-Pleurochrysis_carterae.AAC.3